MLRFGCVGAVGFLADTALLLGLTKGLGLDPLAAKALSFAGAVLVTFELNRRWAFGTSRGLSRRKAFAAYVAVQGTGFACNWAVFTASLAVLPEGSGKVLAAAVIAAAAAMVLNYFGAARLVFGRASG